MSFKIKEVSAIRIFAKDLKKSRDFYKDLFKDEQLISSTESDGEYTIMGVKDGYTFTVCTTENTDQEEWMKDYPTSLAISLVPNPEGMPEGLEGMTGLPAPAN